MEKNQYKNVYYHQLLKGKKIKTYRPTLPIFFQTVTRNTHIYLGLLKHLSVQMHNLEGPESITTLSLSRWLFYPLCLIFICIVLH